MKFLKKGVIISLLLTVILSFIITFLITVEKNKMKSYHQDEILLKKSQDEILLKKSIDFVLQHYLNTYATDRYATDSALLSGWILKVYPHSGLEKYVRNAYSKLVKRPDNFNPNFLRWVDKSYKLTQPLCALNKNESEMDCLLLQSIWCDVVPPRDDFITSLNKVLNYSINSSDCDMASHVLLALSELQANKCIKSATLDPLLENVRQILVKDLSNRKDAYGEGVAFLLRAGYVDDVHENWIKLIRETLRKKITKKCNTCDSRPHDILLEIYALAQWCALKER